MWYTYFKDISVFLCYTTLHLDTFFCIYVQYMCLHITSVLYNNCITNFIFSSHIWSDKWKSITTWKCYDHNECNFIEILTQSDRIAVCSITFVNCKCVKNVACAWHSMVQDQRVMQMKLWLSLKKLWVMMLR